MSILIRDVLLDDKETDIFIKGNRFEKIGKKLDVSAAKVIDAKGKAIIPGLMNAHTHAAMTLFRGYADDMLLHEWLEKKIWPLEAKLTEEDVYWGTRLACLEMIKSGTTFFNDMYWHFHSNARAVEDSGLRAALSPVFIDLFDKEKAKKEQAANEKLYEESKKYSSRIIFSLGPHALYTVSKESLMWIRDFANKHNLSIHFHLSETKKEVDDCIEKYGMRPVEFLESIGFLGDNINAAHTVWVNDKEIEILKKRNVSVVTNPISNMKLSVRNILNYEGLSKAGINIALGTDGAASNNNLSMLDSMKFAALLHKLNATPVLLPAAEVLKMSTRNCAQIFNLDAGEVKEGNLADCCIIDLNNIAFVPRHNITSNLVYSADTSCVDTTICDGKVLMEKGVALDEKKIIRNAEKAASRLIKD